MPARAVAFDLGGTLVDYYHMREFPSILDEVIAAVHQASGSRRAFEVARQAAELERDETGSGQVTPLASRLARIFSDVAPEVHEACCRDFMRPIFKRARMCPDTFETLTWLRKEGYRLAIVSNTPWGSPGELWHEEIARLGLADAVDASVFCTEVGWRKPARQIFDVAVGALGVSASECLFVGDHPEWDAAGAHNAGLLPVLLDRANEYPAHVGPRIQALNELRAILTA